MKKYLYRVNIEIDPNRHRLRVTQHEIEKEFKEEIVVTAEEGKPYLNRVPPGNIGKVTDHSSPGGWLELEVWLRDPSEVDTAKRLLIAAMKKKIVKYEQEAAKLRSKFNIIIAEGLNELAQANLNTSTTGGD